MGVRRVSPSLCSRVIPDGRTDSTLAFDLCLCCCSATAGLEERNGCGTNGNVWEWTSTVFDTHPGFEGTSIFPGYSSDFYDGVHHVVVRVTSLTSIVFSLTCPLLSFTYPIYFRPHPPCSYSSARRMRQSHVLRTAARCATFINIITHMRGWVAAFFMI